MLGPAAQASGIVPHTACTRCKLLMAPHHFSAALAAFFAAFSPFSTMSSTMDWIEG